jgi:flagellar export protein FliJ
MREKALEDRELEMAQIINRLKTEQEKLTKLETSCIKTKESLEALTSVGVDIDFMDIKNHQDYIDKLREYILNQEKIIADVEVELSAKKEEVVAALKAKTILEKLKEKDFGAFLKEYERLDLMQVDEIGISRYKRNQN